MIDDRDLQDYLEATYDPDFDIDCFDGVRETLPGWGYEKEATMPKSELERLRKSARPDTVVQGATLDNVVETFIEVDGHHYALLLNPEHLDFKHGGTTISVSVFKADDQ